MIVIQSEFQFGQLFANLDRLFVSEKICETHFYAHIFLRPQLLQNINSSMLKHVKNSQIDSKMTYLMYDSNFFGVVEVVKRHTRIADTLFFQTRYRTFSTKEL